MFDEPVNGLDPEGIHWIRHLMKSLAAQAPTVFVSSHLMSEMALPLPDQADSRIMQVVPPIDDATPYGPWGGLGIMALWVIAALLGGYVLLTRRDA